MEINLKEYKNKELVVRKRLASFLKKILLFSKNQFSYETYKQFIYNEIPCVTISDFKIKSYYDGLIYIMSNAKNPLTQEILNKFFYIINLKLINDSISLKIVSKLFELKYLSLIEKCIEYHMFIYEILNIIEEEKRLFVSLTFLNYLLVKNNIPCIDITVANLRKYEKYRNEYLLGSKENLYLFIFNTIKDAKFQDKEYYKKLKYLSLKDIKHQFLKDKEKIQKEYKITKLMMFGSFVKGNQRIDSDLDLLVMFDDDITMNEKRNNIESFTDHYKQIFNRFVDVQEIGNLLTDEMLTTFQKIEIII